MTQIIPAIDLIDGCCVRLQQGDYNEKKVYSASPLDMARAFAAAGAQWLHLVDLDGAKASRPCNLQVLRDIVAHTGLQVEWGGGIKSDESLQAVFDAGAARVVCGSIAVDSPQLFEQWLGRYGDSRMVLGADVRDGMVATHGWLDTTAVTLDSLVDRFLPCGLTQVVCTDISRDGMLQGPSWSLYTRLQGKYENIDFTVSGGVGSASHLVEARTLGLRRVIVGKALYEGRITMEELKLWWQNA